MKNKAIKIVGTIVIVGGMVFFASGVGAQEISGKFANHNAGFARVTDPELEREGGKMMGIRHIDPEQAEAVRTALANKDYKTWKALVAEQEVNLPEGAKSLLEKINTEEAFLEFAEKMGSKMDVMKEKMEGRKANEEARKEIQAAVEANDYESWKALVAEREASMENRKFSMLEKIDSAEDFAQLVKIHELQNEILKIKEGLGLLDLGNKVGHRIGQR